MLPSFKLKKTTSEQRWACALILMALILTALIYSNGLHGIFLLDDQINLRPTIINEFSWGKLKIATLSNDSGVFKRPISALSFALTSLAHGDYSWGYKYHNLLIHLSIGLLVFIFSKQLFTLGYPKQHVALLFGPTLITCLWLLHPLHVSTVLYAVQRMTQLSTFFVLLAIIFYIKGRLHEKNTPKLIYYFIWFPFTFLIAILSKENAVLLTLYILIIHILIARSKQTHLVVTKKIDSLFITLFSILPLVAGSAIFILKRQSFLDYSSRSFDMTERVLSQIGFLWLYIQQLLLPRLAKMGLYFDDIEVPTTLTALLTIKLFGLCALIATGCYQLMKGRLIGFSILFFFAGHALESTIIPLELAFEHRNYLPSIGILTIIAITILKLLEGKRLLITIAAISVVLLMSILYLRVDFWSNERDWQRTTLAFHPKSERTQLNYIFALNKYGKKELALKQALKAIETLPDRVSLKFMYLLFACNATSQAPDNQQIINDIFKHLRSHNLTVMGFNNLASLAQYLTKRQCNSISFSNIENIVNTALFHRPNQKGKSNIDENLWLLKGLLASARGSSFEASEYFRKGYTISKNFRLKAAEIKTLLFQPETRTVGHELLQHELNRTTHLSLSSKKELEQISIKVKNNDFSFSY